MENMYEKVFYSIKGLFNIAAVFALPIWFLALLWSPDYVAGANSWGAQIGNAWIMMRGDIFLITTLVLMLEILLSSLYLVPLSTYAVPVVLGGRVVHRVWKGGTHIFFPLTSLVLLPTSTEESTATESGIESLDGYENQAMARYVFRLREGSKNRLYEIVEKLLSATKEYKIRSIHDLFQAFLKTILKDVYENINNENFLHSPSEREEKVEKVKSRFIEMVEEIIGTGIDMFDVIKVLTCSYVYDPDFIKVTKKKDIAEQEAKAALIKAENAKAVQKLQAEALRFSMEMQAEGKKYGGLRDAEVQERMGQVLKEYNELIFQEAMRNLPDCLSLGGSGVDMATIAAGMWSAYRKATSTTPPIVPPFTGPSGSLPKP